MIEIVRGVKELGSTARQTFFPTDAEIQQEIDAKKTLKITIAENELSACYFNHENEPFNDDCVPCACADAMKKV